MLSVGYEQKESKESGWSRPQLPPFAHSAFIGRWAGGQPEKNGTELVRFWNCHQKLSYRGKAVDPKASWDACPQ